MRTAAGDLQRQLEAFVRAQAGADAPAISAPARLGVGRSRENWVFDARWPHGRTEHLILRQDPPGGLVETDRGVEFAVLRALEGASLPTPRALWLDADARYFDRPALVMIRAPGSCEYDVLNSDRPLPARHRLASGFVDLLAAVHNLDWRGCGLGEVLAHPGPSPARTELDRWEGILRRDQLEAYPELELVIGHLAGTAPACAEPVLVHADFKPGNILLDGPRGAEHVTALLDWELAHLGDPHEDLGWVTQPLRTREHLIAGGWQRADYLAHYGRVRGVEVDHDAVAWWNIFAGFKTAVMQVSGLRSFLEGRSSDLYRPHPKVLRTLLAAIGTADATHS